MTKEAYVVPDAQEYCLRKVMVVTAVFLTAVLTGLVHTEVVGQARSLRSRLQIIGIRASLVDDSVFAVWNLEPVAGAPLQWFGKLGPQGQVWATGVAGDVGTSFSQLELAENAQLVAVLYETASSEDRRTAVRAFDRVNGRLLWDTEISQDAGRDAHEEEHLAASDDLLVLTAGDRIFTLEARTGAIVSRDIMEGTRAPVRAGNSVLLIGMRQVMTWSGASHQPKRRDADTACRVGDRWVSVSSDGNRYRVVRLDTDSSIYLPRPEPLRHHHLRACAEHAGGVVLVLQAPSDQRTLAVFSRDLSLQHVIGLGSGYFEDLEDGLEHTGLSPSLPRFVPLHQRMNGISSLVMVDLEMGTTKDSSPSNPLGDGYVAMAGRAWFWVSTSLPDPLVYRFDGDTGHMTSAAQLKGTSLGTLQRRHFGSRSIWMHPHGSKYGSPLTVRIDAASLRRDED